MPAKYKSNVTLLDVSHMQTNFKGEVIIENSRKTQLYVHDKNVSNLNNLLIDSNLRSKILLPASIVNFFP